MARVAINTGASANDGLGDNLRAAGGILNNNFLELYTYLGAGSTTVLSAPLWSSTNVGINTLRNVGIGTTNPRFTLEVGAVGASGTTLFVNGDARVTGIVTIGPASITLNGITNIINVGTGITINGSTGIISATSIVLGGTTLTGAAVTSITAGSGISVNQSTGNVTITATGGGGSSQWVTTAAGIHTLSNVGIGTTNPTSALTVTGNALVTGVVTATTFVGALTGTATSTTNIPNLTGDIISNGTSASLGSFTSAALRTALTSSTGTGDAVFATSPTFATPALGTPASGTLTNCTFPTLNQNTTGTAGGLSGTPNITVGVVTATALNVGTGGTVITTTTAGLVGIGTTNPTSKLTVSGDALINGLTVGLGNGAVTSNTAIGSSALYSNTTGVQNTANGGRALYFNTTGDGNTSTGYQALYYNTTGDFNTANGGGALAVNTGNQNTATGYGALNANTTSNYNTAIGSQSLGFNTTGSQNTATGKDALYSNTTGSNNTANGYQALYSSTGTNNTGIGASAGLDITTGSKNTILGSYDGNQNGLDIRTSNNNVVLSDGDGNIRFYANSSGNVGLGTTNPTSALTVKGNTSLETLSVSGVSTLTTTDFTGHVQLKANSGNSSLYIFDDNGIYAGTGGDLRIWHNSSDSISRITEDGGQLIIDANPITINHGGNTKLQTIGSGITVTGTTVTNQLSVSGISTLGTVQISSGIVTATSGIVTFYGDASYTASGRWTLGANGSADYTFTGIGFTQTTNDPVLYLARGRVYEFVNNSGGGHPFEIRTSNGGSAYSNGVTNNAAASGIIRFEIPFNAPNTLYYQCTNHSGMGNTISVYPSTL